MKGIKDIIKIKKHKDVDYAAEAVIWSAAHDVLVAPTWLLAISQPQAVEIWDAIEPLVTEASVGGLGDSISICGAEKRLRLWRYTDQARRIGLREGTASKVVQAVSADGYTWSVSLLGGGRINLPPTGLSSTQRRKLASYVTRQHVLLAKAATLLEPSKKPC